MASRRAAFLAGDRPEDVHVFLHESVVSNLDPLLDHGERVENGVALVVPGEDASSIFESATGIAPMAFARQAMDTDGDVADDCTDGTCPECGADEPRFVFAFLEEQNDEAGGLYAEGPVMHGYAACQCGTYYSEKWVVDGD